MLNQDTITSSSFVFDFVMYFTFIRNFVTYAYFCIDFNILDYHFFVKVNIKYIGEIKYKKLNITYTHMISKSTFKCKL